MNKAYLITASKLASLRWGVQLMDFARMASVYQLCVQRPCAAPKLWPAAKTCEASGNKTAGLGCSDLCGGASLSPAGGWGCICFTGFYLFIQYLLIKLGFTTNA
jgi:hypothetical protein